MKKYLMKGFAAIVFCGAIASCSHDLGADDGAVQSTVQETYEKAFVTQFGQPASTQNWGFGPNTTAKTRAVNHNIIPGKVWPQKAGTRAIDGDSYYKVSENENPADGESKYMYNGSDIVAKITFGGTGSAAVSSNNSDYPYKISRDYIIFKSLMDSDNGAIYTQHDSRAQDGAKLMIIDLDDNNSIIRGEWPTYENDPYNGNIKSGHSYKIYFNDNQPITFYGMKFYARGNTIDDNSTEETTTTPTEQGGETNTGTLTTLYNQNGVTCSVTDDFPARFDQSYFETIHQNMDEFHQTTSNNNFEFVSTGPFDFSVIYSVTSAHDEVGFYYYNPAAGQTVDDRTEVRFVDDIQNNNNYFRACSDTDDDISCGQAGYGIWSWPGVNEVKAKVFTIDVPEGYRVGFWIQNHPDPYPTFYSNQSLNTSDGLYYSAVVNLEDDTFLVGLEDWWSKWGSDNDCNDIIMSVKKGTTPPTIVVPDEEFQEIVVLAEDLTIDDAHPDFDFNDVVFKVRRYTAGDRTGKTEVTVLAAGGTLPLYIDDQEVHAKFAEENPNKVITTGTMINTYGGRHSEYATPTFEVTATGSTIQEIANSIKLQVEKFGELIDITAPVGAVPAKIAVDTDFLLIDWCDERTDINNKFTDKEGNPLFSKYVQGQLDNDWYLKLHQSNKQTNQ